MTRPNVARPLAVSPADAEASPESWRHLSAARIIHPFPTLLNVAAVAGLASVATHGVPAAWVLFRMLAVMLCAQCAIGVANDYFDRDLDAATKPWKPIVAGLVSPSTAARLACALAVATAVVSATLGSASFALAMLGMVCGLAYDARLKRSLFSAVPYMAAIPTLPLWVWVTLGRWEAVLWWLLPLGACIGLALHLSNTLPDLDGDATNGVVGLAHALGAGRSVLLACGSFGAALLMSVLPAFWVSYDLRFYAPTIAIGMGALVLSAFVFMRGRTHFVLQLGFGVLSLASAVLAVGWLATVT